MKNLKRGILKKLNAFAISMDSENVTTSIFDHEYNGIYSFVVFDIVDFMNNRCFSLVFINKKYGNTVTITIQSDNNCILENETYANLEKYFESNKSFRLIDDKKDFEMEGFLSSFKKQVPDKYIWNEIKEKLIQEYKRINRSADFGKHPKIKKYKKLVSMYFAEKYLKPFDFVQNDSDKRVFAKINDLGDSETKVLEGKMYVLISIVNKNMIEADYEYFYSKNDKISELQYIYKPYYYEFIAEIDSHQRKELIDLVTRTEKDTWHLASLELNEPSTINAVVFSGIVEFSASPFRECKTYLEFNNSEIEPDVLDKLNTLDKFDIGSYQYDNDTLRNVLKEHLGVNDNRSINVKIYDVGQANCIYLRNGNPNQRVLFDIGLPKNLNGDRKKDNVKKSIKDIKRMKPSMVILSHWDMDHIKGVFLLERETFEKYWIAPGFVKGALTNSAKCLARYLNKNGRLLMVPECNILDRKRNIYQEGRVSLWKGDAKKHSLNNKNNCGLILVFDIDDNSTIFSGDCEYDSWPDRINLKCNKNLVVPHHGSKMGFSKIKNPHVKRDAYISVGLDGRRYSHPDVCHQCLLKRAGYDIKSTLENGSQSFEI